LIRASAPLAEGRGFSRAPTQAAWLANSEECALGTSAINISYRLDENNKIARQSFSAKISSEVGMSNTPYLDDFEANPETKRVLGVALEMTRVSLGLGDNFADGIIAKRIVELAKAGERNPDLLSEGALEQLRGHLYGD
jgi:hypothetical protein